MQRRPTHPAGVTLLEVIVATAMLTMLAGLITGGMSFLDALRVRSLHRLNGVEIAHRVIAGYLDDSSKLGDGSEPDQFGDFFYAWELREEVIELDESGRARSNVSSQMDAMDAIPNMLRRVTVRVYLADPRFPDLQTGTPVAELERVFSPLFLNEEESLARIMEMVMQAQQQQNNAARERRDNERSNQR